MKWKLKGNSNANMLMSTNNTNIPGYSSNSNLNNQKNNTSTHKYNKLMSQNISDKSFSIMNHDHSSGTFE